MASQPPPATGVRILWSEMPPRLHAALQSWLGAPVAEVAMQPGGFSPGVAARVRAADGRRVFVKAVGPELNPDSPAIHRREGQIVAALPATAPVPRLLWTHDEGEGGWIMLVFEDVEGRQPEQPWRAEEVDRVLEAIVRLADTLTPSPIRAGSAGDTLAALFRGWQDLQDRRPESLDAWSVRHLDALAALEAAAVAAVAGETLLHLDVRADNILLTPDRVLFVDWPHACTGASWVDLVLFAPSLAMQGGPSPEEVLARYPGVEAANESAITAVVAALAGYFTQRSLLPPPPGLPTVRAFQAAQGVVAREWAARRTGWD
ncbi:MAG: aminoglycoside phosphotransferase family protein [Chloroflexi bacterium]|nr:aminoglycoside phosphotransferase family protein [Chloroflexota bacterium]